MAQPDGGGVGLTEALGPLFHSQPHASTSLVLTASLLMTAAGGLGALPFFFVRHLSHSLAGLATASACGVMLAASFDLIHEGQPHGGGAVFFGVLAGAAFIQWVQRSMGDFKGVTFHDLQGSAARKSAMMVAIMASHALGEGAGVGVSFAGPRGRARGTLTSLAIGVHNVPEGLATATVLVGQGMSPRAAAIWAVLSCAPQAAVALPAYLFVDAFAALLPGALGFAAGCMIWMVVAELLPEALAPDPDSGERGASAPALAMACTLSAAALEGSRMALEGLEVDGGAGLRSPLLRDLVLPYAVLTLLASVAAGIGGLAAAHARPPRGVALGFAGAVSVCAGGAGVLSSLAKPGVSPPVIHVLAAVLSGGTGMLLLRRSLYRRCLQHCRAAERARAEDDAAEDGRAVSSDPSMENGFAGMNGRLSHDRRAGSKSQLGEKSFEADDRPDPLCVLAGVTGVAAAAAGAVPLGWTWAAALLVRRSAAMLAAPVVLSALPTAAATGAAIVVVTAGTGAARETQTARRRRVVSAAWAAAAGVVAVALVACFAALARYPVRDATDAAVVLQLWRYPLGLQDTAAAAAGGAALVAGLGALGAGMGGGRPGRARGGAVLGAVFFLLCHGLERTLCALGPYCMDATSNPV